MKIEVTFRGIEPSKALREHAVRRLEAQLADSADAVTAVFVRFVARRDAADGVDRHCQITIAFAHRSGSATLEAQHPDPRVALDLAAARIGHGLAHTRRTASPPARLMWTPA